MMKDHMYRVFSGHGEGTSLDQRKKHIRDIEPGRSAEETGTETFTHSLLQKRFYTWRVQGFFDTESVTHRRCFSQATQKFLCAHVSTRKNFYTRSIYIQRPLHTGPFTHKAFHIQTFSCLCTPAAGLFHGRALTAKGF